MNNIIVNADDFGLSSTANAAIADCFKKGIINRTTLMVNGPCLEEAVRISKEQDFFEHVGLHINLTFGYPISKRIQDTILCKEDGAFSGELLKAKYFAYCPYSLREVIKEEVEAQIQLYLDYGFTLSHADSHRHIHTRIPIFNIIKGPLLNHGFQSVRISRNIKEQGLSFFSSIYKRILNELIIKKNFPNHSDYMCALSDWISVGKKFDNVEIMVHPDLDEDGKLFDRNQRKKDYSIQSLIINNC